MNEKIEIGEYVRTKDGYIAKLINYGTNKGINGKSVLFDGAIRDISNLIYDEDNFLFDCELDEYIVKHSKDILDLIETGDYVNGERVLCFRNIYNCDYDIGIEYRDDFGEYYGYNKEDIKSIVTKEQFKEMEYKVD